MKKVVLHIGYPKTATKTIQIGLFARLQKEGRLSYLGPGCEEGFDERWLFENLFFNLNPNSIYGRLSKEIISIISHEYFTLPADNYQRKYNVNYFDPLILPEIIANLFSDKNDKIIILVTLRSQQTLIYSQYVQQYKLFMNDKKNNSFARHLHTGLYEHKSLFAPYHFVNILNYYASCFGKENIKILLFEDLLNDRDIFFSGLSDILSVDVETIKSCLEYKHINIKEKTPGGYIVKKKRKTVAGKINRYFGQDNFIRQYYKYLKARQVDNAIINWFEKKFNQKEIIIPKPTEKQKELICNEFRDGNILLSTVFGVDREKLKLYGYI